MRIVRISHRVEPEPGGQQRHVACLTRLQLARGHQVALAYRHGDAPTDGAGVLPLRPTPLSRVLAARSDTLAFGAEVARALRRAGPVDLVHLHGDHVEAVTVGPACRRLRIPLVLSVHAALNLRQAGFARWALRHVGAFVALGARPTADLVALGVDPDAILTTSSGVDLAGMAAYRGGLREPGLVVSVGALDPMKNHPLTIDAVRRLRVTRPDLRLVIAGDGPDRAHLTRLAGTDGGVTLAGPLPRDAVYRLLARAEAFVLSSCRLGGKGEGVPTAALEALALGVPVIVSTDASLDPVVPDTLGAYRTFRSGSPDDLATVLLSVLDSADERRRLSARGQAAAAARDWPVVADGIERWYRRVLVRREVAGDRQSARV